MPRLARQLSELGAAHDVDLLDAPVSGGEVGAKNASLSIMVGGTEAAFVRALPLLKHMGINIVHVGPSGSGQVVKAANQVIVALTIEAVAEALTLVARAGGDAARAREVMQGGFASSRILGAARQADVGAQFCAGRLCANASQGLADCAGLGARVWCDAAGDAHCGRDVCGPDPAGLRGRGPFGTR